MSENRWSATILALCLVPVACSRAAGYEATKAAPAASASKKTSDGEVAKLTLSPSAEQRLGLTLQPALRKRVRRTRSVGGDVVPPSGRSLVVTAPVAGTVSAIGTEIVKAGQTVKRGEAVLRLVPVAGVDRDVRAQAERAVASATTRLQTSEARVTRTEKLLEDGAASAKMLEEAQSERDVLQSEVEAARARVDMLTRSPLASDIAVVLRAPEAGRVRNVSVGSGAMVAGGAPLFEVVGTGKMWIKVSVFAGDLRALKPDSPALVRGLTTTAGAEDVEALPVQGPPTSDAATATVDFYYSLPPSADFQPGERVSVTLTYGQEVERLVVPWSAVLHDASGGALVYQQVSEHSYQRRRIEVDHVDANDAVLARGLESDSGEVQVVSTGAAELWAFELGNAK